MPKEKNPFICNVLAGKTAVHQIGDYVEFWLNNRTGWTLQQYLNKMSPA